MPEVRQFVGEGPAGCYEIQGRCVETNVRPVGIGLLAAGLLALGACDGQRVTIDWVDFLQWNGITYLAIPPGSTGLTSPVLGPQVATTKRKLAENETNPAYRPKDGDAAFLEVGTQVFAVEGYRSTFRVAVQTSGKAVVYEADTNPAAKSGADLMDLEGRVVYIGVQGTDARSELAAIHDAAVVSHLVEIILQAPVDQAIQPPQDETQYFVAFHFRDGTQSLRAFWPSMGLLQRGILAGPEFARSIVSSLPYPAA